MNLGDTSVISDKTTLQIPWAELEQWLVSGLQWSPVGVWLVKVSGMGRGVNVHGKVGPIYFR